MAALAATTKVFPSRRKLLSDEVEDALISYRGGDVRFGLMPFCHQTRRLQRGVVEHGVLRQRQVKVEEVSQTGEEPPLQVGTRDIVPTLLHLLAHAPDGVMQGGEMKIAEIQAVAPRFGLLNQGGIGESTECGLEGEAASLCHTLLPSREQQTRCSSNLRLRLDTPPLPP